MNTKSISGKNQQEPSGRRGFMRKISAASAAIIVSAAPAHAGAIKAEPAVAELNNRQRMLLKYYEQLSDSVQLMMIDMAEELASAPTLRRMPVLGAAA